MNELNTLLRVVKCSEIEVPVYLAAYFGLRRSGALGVKWDATVGKESGILCAYGVDSLKIHSSFRTLDKFCIVHSLNHTLQL